MRKDPLILQQRAIRICALPFAALFVFNASAASASWNQTSDAVWNTGENSSREFAAATTIPAVFDARVAMDLHTMPGDSQALVNLKITTQTGLITIGGASMLTLGAGGVDMGAGMKSLAMDTVLALAAEQSRSESSGQASVPNGAMAGANVNLSRIGLGDLTLSGANIFAGTVRAADEPLTVPANLKGLRTGNFAAVDFATLSIGAAPRVSPMERARFREDSGVVRSAANGGKRIVKISTHSSGKPVTADGSSLELRASLELKNGTGPLLGTVAPALSQTGLFNTDAGNLTLNAENIVTVIHQNAGRQYVSSRLVPLVSPPLLANPIGVNFTGNADNGNYGIYLQGPTQLRSTDFVNGQSNWNNLNTPDPGGNGYGFAGNIVDSLNNTVGSVQIYSDSGGGPLNGSRQGGGEFPNLLGPNGGFGAPTDDPLQVLYNGLDYAMNHGVIRVTLNGPTVSFKMYIFGSGGQITVHDESGPNYTTVGGLGSFGTPGFSYLTLPSTTGTTSYTFGEHGNFENTGYQPAYAANNRGYAPFISAFQFVPLEPPVAYWKGSTNSVWNASPSNFTSDLAGTTPITLQSSFPAKVIFNASGATNFTSTTLGADITIKSLTFASNAVTAVGIGGSNTLTIKPDTSTTGVTVESLSGNHTISTKVALGANQTWTVTDATPTPQILTVSGAISGAFSLAKAGAGTLILSGANTFTGATTISEGVLSINSIQNAGSATPNALGNPAAGPGSSIGLAASATLKYTGSANGSSDRPIQLSTPAGGTFTLDASGSTAFSLSSVISNAGTSGITILSLTGTGSGSVNSVIGNGSSPNVTAVVKNGSGIWTLSGANTYTSTSTVDGGTLVVSGSISGSATTVNSGGTLAGDNGTLGNVTINSGGTFSPGGGAATGSLTVNGNLALNPSSILSVQFDSSAPATDQIALNGNLNIATGAVLNVNDIGSSPELVYNIPASIITYSGTWNGGTFLGLPDDSYFSSAGRNFLISYNGADPDVPERIVTLTMVQNVPEPSAAVSLLGGMGMLFVARRRAASSTPSSNRGV